MEKNTIYLSKVDPARATKEIGDFIVQKVLDMKQTGVVIGLSGGIDSTTSAAIAQHAFSAYNAGHTRNPLEVVGYILPSSVNASADAEDGKKVAERLGIRFEEHNLENVLQAYQATNPEALASKFHKGNLISRIRANVLNTKGATERKLVLGTGNRDEDFGVGYYTLFGDGAVHLSPIGNLPKRLVREVATHLGFADLAYRVPTAGLEVGQTDFKDLGYSYDLVEIVSEGILQGMSREDITSNDQVREVATKDFAQYRQDHGEEKFSTVEEAVYDIFERNKIAIAKASLISPDIAPVTLDYALGKLR